MLESILNIFKLKPVKTIYQERIECMEQMLAATIASSVAEIPAHVEIHDKKYAKLYVKCNEILKE